MDFHTTILLVIAALNAVPAALAAVYSWRSTKETLRTAHEAALARAEIRIEIEAARKDVKTIEIATNGMKDALVRATGDAKLAEGREIGRAEERAKNGKPSP